MGAQPPTTAVSDSDLVRRSIAGDRTSMTELHTRYASRVMGYCVRLLSDPQTARDAVQSTFLKGFESLHTLDDPSLFYYWIFSIARNEVFSLLRLKRRNGQSQNPDDDTVWVSESTHDTFVRKELRDLVVEALGMLKPEYREVLVLQQFEQLSYAEISAITGDSVSSVESRLFKARKALMKKLEPYVDEWRKV
jgi:RNA polymerase sigma-70 factor (ECF subfamily)